MTLSSRVAVPLHFADVDVLSAQLELLSSNASAGLRTQGHSITLRGGVLPSRPPPRFADNLLGEEAGESPGGSSRPSPGRHRHPMRDAAAEEAGALVAGVVGYAGERGWRDAGGPSPPRFRSSSPPRGSPPGARGIHNAGLAAFTAATGLAVTEYGAPRAGAEHGGAAASPARPRAPMPAEPLPRSAGRGGASGSLSGGGGGGGMPSRAAAAVRLYAAAIPASSKSAAASRVRGGGEGAVPRSPASLPLAPSPPLGPERGSPAPSKDLLLTLLMMAGSTPQANAEAAEAAAREGLDNPWSFPLTLDRALRVLTQPGALEGEMQGRPAVGGGGGKGGKHARVHRVRPVAPVELAAGWGPAFDSLYAFTVLQLPRLIAEGAVQLGMSPPQGTAGQANGSGAVGEGGAAAAQPRPPHPGLLLATAAPLLAALQDMLADVDVVTLLREAVALRVQSRLARGVGGGRPVAAQPQRSDGGEQSVAASAAEENGEAGGDSGEP